MLHTEDNSIFIAYSLNNSPIEGFIWSRKIEILPEKIRKRCNRFLRWQDRQACIIGKLLLSECLEKSGFSSDLLKNWQTDSNGKPFIDRDISFNISHTDGCVVCAVSSGNLKIGIDIEKITMVNPKDFESALGKDIVAQICMAPNPAKQFYRYWTAMESVLKADGRGFLFDPGKIQLYWDTCLAVIHHNIWQLTPVNITSEFVCHLSSSGKLQRIYTYHSKILSGLQ